MDFFRTYSNDLRVANLERDVAVTGGPCVETFAFKLALAMFHTDPVLARAFSAVRWVEPTDLEGMKTAFEEGQLGLIVIAGDLGTAIDAIHPDSASPADARLRAASADYARIAPFASAYYCSVAKIKRHSAAADLPLTVRLVAPRLSRDEAQRCADILAGCLQDAAVALRIKDAPGEKSRMSETPAKDIVKWRLHAAQALAPLDAHAPGGLRSGWWPREIFLTGVNPASMCPPSLDLTGMPRILVYGPYLWLSAGVWRARWSFEADPTAAESRFRFDACSGHTELVSRVVQLSGPGVYESEVVFDLAEPGPIETRLWLETAALDGTIAFKGISIVSHDG